MRQGDLIVNPTLACGNPLNFKEDLDILEKTGIKILHIDIMDGHYVPNLCFDTGMVGRIRKNYSFLLDVHLMVTNPEAYIQPLAAAGADYVSFHFDATHFPIRMLNQIRENGMKGGVVLNPAQSPELLAGTLPYLDFVLVMGVEPGFSGQKFLEGTVEKVRKLKSMREQMGLSYLIEADGGVDRENTVTLLKQGADILVSGAFGVFEGRNGLEQDCREYQELALRAAGEKQMDL
ncbi:ribulose-phosphate 3-epimerase [Hungatella hominis]|uniref:Ribulose-phosphate 3-epimerase n=1 Tax=Hungatella hominis TaxID=2763050 RepID=A0ABR7HEA9_9FIRM|nr:ribulose-phosphate 3-epimerase [Hungatella hominis]MBC5711441.1 ribulose-phosphate 3-epimerase [Hungatella hominis]